MKSSKGVMILVTSVASFSDEDPLYDTIGLTFNSYNDFDVISTPGGILCVLTSVYLYRYYINPILGTVIMS